MTNPFVRRHPYVAATGCAAAQFALTVLLFETGVAFFPQAMGAIRTTVFASTILLPILLAHVLGLWREVGLTTFRANAVFFVSLLACAAFLSRGIHVQAPGSVGSDLAIQFLNAFGEELLFRGVIFALLAGVPRWRSFLLSGVLFGSMHLIRGVMESDWTGAFAQMAVTAAAGFMFVAVRDATGSLWTSILLHMLLNLSIMYSNLEPSAGPAAYFAVARAVNVFECAVAVWVLARRKRAPSAAPAAGRVNL